MDFIARTEQKPNIRKVRYSPIQNNPRRLVPVLDSIANLCVRDPYHEVVAVALRIHNDVELITAANSDVSSATEIHLKNLWKALQQLSSDYCAANGAPEKSPPRPDHDSLTSQGGRSQKYGKLLRLSELSDASTTVSDFFEDKINEYQHSINYLDIYKAGLVEARSSNKLKPGEFNQEMAPILDTYRPQWREVVEKALKTRNDNRHEEAEELEIDPVELEHDLAKMVSQHLTSKNRVHCEPPVSRAYTYIGISKLSCRGCQIFIQASNKVHHTRFSSKGQHHKAYYPWQFPNFPKSAEVAKEMYVALCNRFSNQYV
ncbi:hypothetical protein V8E54_007860 [Elaphomyces granulatus]